MSVMLAKPYSQRHIENWDEWAVEPKLDGIRVICLVKAKSVKFYSRNMRELTMFRHLCIHMLTIAVKLRKHREFTDGIMFDGEMCGSTFNEIGGAIHRKDHTEKTASYHIFHTMPLKHFRAGEDCVDQEVRKDQLRRALFGSSLKGLYYVSHAPAESHENTKAAYREFSLAGYEGAIVKNLGSPWVAKRSSNWLKIKAQKTVDVPIIGWKKGTGKYAKTLGALIVDYKGKPVRVSGMTDKERNWFWKHRHEIDGYTVEVEYQLVTEGGSLRHPRFVRLRYDKG